MDHRVGLAAASRDGHLALRRVERQHELVELLRRSGPLSARQLAERLRVSTRTVERDVERLRDAGVPFLARAGRGGGLSLPDVPDRSRVELDVAEVAAIISSLAVIGPNSSPSASSAAAKLAALLRPRTSRTPPLSRLG